MEFSQEKFEELRGVVQHLANIFPEDALDKMDAADFVDRSHTIWEVSRLARIALE